MQYAGRMLTGISGAGVLDEKASAVSALGAYAGDMGAAFGPYIEATLKVLLDLAGVLLLSRLWPPSSSSPGSMVSAAQVQAGLVVAKPASEQCVH